MKWLCCCEDCSLCGIAFGAYILPERNSLSTAVYVYNLWRWECEARPSGWHGKGVKGGDILPFLCYYFTEPWPRLFSDSDVCVCVFVLAPAYPPNGILLLMSHSCLLRPQWEHHTHLCTSRASPTGNVCFLFTILPLFPIKRHKGECHPVLSCQTEIFSPRFSESAPQWFWKEEDFAFKRI